MTNRIWKLLGFLLVACLLLSGVSALAENGKNGTLTVTLNKDETTGFTFIKGVTFELYKIGVPDGKTDTAWAPAPGFENVTLLETAPADKENKVWNASEIDAIIGQVEGALSSNTPVDEQVTDATGKAVFAGLVPGIYYCRKSIEEKDKKNYPRLLEVFPFLIAVPSLNTDNPYNVAANLVSPVPEGVKPKYKFTPPELTDYSVTKVWRDDDDFDGMRPKEITVKLQREYKGRDKEEFEPDADFNKEHESGVKLTATNDWYYIWTNDTDKLKPGTYTKIELPITDEDKNEYRYSAVEVDRVYEQDPEYGDHIITNPHTPDYGCLEVTKAVTIGNKDPNGSTLADGVYAFTITGPNSYEAPKTKNEKNYLDNVPFNITIIKGQMADTDGDGQPNPAKLNKLMPGTYTIKEVGMVQNNQIVPLPNSMESTATSGVEVTVTANHTEQAPMKFTITNNLNTGDLIITKKVTLNGRETTDARLNATYSFTVTGPEQYLANVDITVKGGKSDSKTLEGLVPGEYTVTENTDKLPAGVSATSGSGDTITVVAGDTVNAIVTNDLGIGSIKITKTVTVNGKATTGTQADGTYTFTVKGPSYPTGHTETIKITKGAANSVQLDNLLAGSYTVSEVTSKLPSKMTLSSTNDLRLNVTGGTVTDASFTNDLTTTTTTRPPVVVNPTPTPNPTISINGQKIWNDESNVHNTRPNSIIVHLLRNGAQIQEINLDGTGDRWSYRFSNLPQFDANGADYVYTVRESDVAGYTGTVDGFTIVNDLIPQNPNEYTNFTGQKTWNDANNADGVRPNYIIIRLIRDGEEVDRRTVTAANSWQYTFQNVPLDDGYGHEYTYAIREDAVPGYVTRIDGFQVTNSRLVEIENFDTPLSRFGEQDLEDLIELYDYKTPLWGRPLKTGDEMPLYPMIFGGIGLTALVALAILIVIGKKRGNNAA